MFSNLTNFSYRRNLKEAIGFYIFYLVLLLILAVVLALVLSFVYVFTTHARNAVWFASIVGSLVSAGGCILLYLKILISKHLQKNPLFILLFLLTIFLSSSSFGGALLGLIPVVYLSTK